MYNRLKVLSLRAALVVALLGANTLAFAQDNGAAGLTSGATAIRSYITPVTNIATGLGTVIGIVGIIRVYNKYHNGDPDTQKGVINWVGGVLFLGGALILLKSFFN